jgi:hypothetical protein
VDTVDRAGDALVVVVVLVLEGEEVVVTVF